MVRVLIVDDSPIVTKALGVYLTGKGFDVHVSNTSFGVTNKIRQYTPHILLMDLGMPGLTGEKLLTLCNTEDCRFRTIIVSSAEEQKLKSLVSQGLADDFFIKGTPLEHLESKIRLQYQSIAPGGRVGA
jgi:DNA-binding response OmpR family regulator